MNLKQAVIFAQKKFKDKDIASASLDAEVLLLEALNKKRKIKADKVWLYMNLEKYVLSKKEEENFLSFVRRRENREPIAYICKRKEFYGRNFFVDKNVLIPRPETEMLVDEAVRIIKRNTTAQLKKKPAIMDIGTGSGCIIISIMSEAKKIGIDKRMAAFADDISPEAIRISESNARTNKVRSAIEFTCRDLEESLEKIEKFRNIIITANLPYLSQETYSDLKDDVKNFEPHMALVAPEKGLCHINRLIRKLSPLAKNLESFHLLIEADPMQMKTIEKTARTYIPGCKTKILKDLRNKNRLMEIYKE